MVFIVKTSGFKKKVLVLILGSLFFLCLCSCQKKNFYENFVWNIENFRLENGLRLILLRKTETPLVGVTLLIETGAASSPEYAGTGIAHLVEHMLFKSSGKYKDEEINRKFSSFGGYINAYTTLDYTAVHFSVLSGHLEEALEVLSDMIFNARFLPDEAEKEKQVILNEINLGLDDGEKRLSRDLFAAAYQRSPYQHPIIGCEDLLVGLSREEIYDFYKQNYCANNMIVSVAGDFEKDFLKQKIDEYFGIYKREKPLKEAFVEEPRQIASRRQDVKFETPVDKVALAYRSVDIFDKNLFALDVLSVICADMPDSILKTELVEEKRIAYSVDAYNYTPLHEGLFVITVDCAPDKTEEVIGTVKKIMADIKKGSITHRQLERAKKFFLADYYKGRQTNEDLAADMAIAYALTGDVNFSKKYVDSIKKIVLPQLTETACEYFTDSNLTVVVLSGRQHELQGKSEELLKEEPVMHVLDGGVRVILRKDASSPLVNFRVTYLGGLTDEFEPYWGISNLTASLLFEGTGAYSREEIDELLSRCAAFYSVYSGNNTFGFSVEVLRQHTPDILKLIDQLIFYPSFDLSQIEKQKQIIKSAIEQQKTDVFQLGYLSLKEALYAGRHPFAYSGLGSVESLGLISRKDILDYYQSHLNGDGIVISVFGNFKTEEVMPYLKNICAKLEKNKKIFAENKPVDLPKNLSEKKRITKYLQKEQSMAMIGYKTTGIKSRDRFALEVLSGILSVSGERLYEAIRNQEGFAYALGAFNTYGLNEGFFTVYAATAEEHAEQVLELIEQQLALIREDGLTVEEVERVKESIIGEFLRSLQANSGFSFLCSLDEIYGFGYDFYDEYPKRIREITREDIKKIIDKYFVKKNAVEVVVLPRSK